MAIGTVRRKVARAWADGTLPTKLMRHITNLVYVPLVSVVRATRLAPKDRGLDLRAGFSDHRGSQAELRCSDCALERIAAAYRSSQADRYRCPPALLVRGVWAEWLDIHYGPLRTMLASHDIDSLRRLLENFHREPMSTGVGGTIDDVTAVPRWFVAPYYRVLWARYRDLLATARTSWPAIATPIAGNPHGLMYDGHLITVETLRHAFHARKALDQFDGSARINILEIGAGLGGQAQQLLDLAPDLIASYVVLDLPEVASLSAYFLMASLGEQQVRLFGESSNSSSTESHKIDIGPHWHIADLEDDSFDLVFNAYSFSEMDSATSTYYLDHISRICRGVFIHINHETRFRYRLSDGTESVNRIGSEVVPDPERFLLTASEKVHFRRPENWKNHAFAYVYKRCDQATWAHQSTVK